MKSRRKKKSGEENEIDANGLPKDMRSDLQRRSMTDLIELLKETFPEAMVVGHNQLSAYNKANICPGFKIN